MGCQDGVRRIRHKEVYVLRIGLIHVFYLDVFPFSSVVRYSYAIIG